jgi:hypothetical protein
MEFVRRCRRCGLPLEPGLHGLRQYHAGCPHLSERTRTMQTLPCRRLCKLCGTPIERSAHGRSLYCRQHQEERQKISEKERMLNQL